MFHRLLLVSLGVLVLLAGCGPETTLQLSYSRPAAFEVPAKIRQIAVSEFTTAGNAGRQWGDVAADKLVSSLDQQNKKYERYSLTDRKKLKEIMDQRDVNVMVSNASTAVQVGKLAKVDAIIYGTVMVTQQRDHIAKQVPTLGGSTYVTTKTVYVTRQTCQIQVTFTMDDVNTGMTLVAMSPKRDFDSDKASKGGLAKFVGMGGEPAPADQVINGLIDECVDEFIARISPHDVSIPVKLGNGKSETVVTGNKLAAAGDTDEAITCYERAAKEHPDDADAFFNAGVMYEKRLQWKESERMYSRAFEIKPEERFIEARRRVRNETGQANGATGPEKTSASSPSDK